jgi:3-hydroxyacyl-[acyl-carrier-protein] dehydratase
MMNLSLPIPAREIIPHRRPMRIVDRLMECDAGAGSGRVEAVVRHDGFVLTEKGGVDPPAFFEMIAQAYAAVKGYENLRNGLPVRGGYLVGIRSGVVTGTAFPGDRLVLFVRTEKSLGDFSVAEGRVSRSGEDLARAVIKVWSPE